MRALFSEEAARELGYQKHWPEKKDWVLAVLGSLAAGGVFVGVIVSVLMFTGNWNRQFEPNPCKQYANENIASVPAKCARYFGLTVHK